MEYIMFTNIIKNTETKLFVLWLFDYNLLTQINSPNSINSLKIFFSLYTVDWLLLLFCFFFYQTFFEVLFFF